MADQPANFDRIARPYRWLEYLTFGPYLERCRNHFLNQLGQHCKALILGDGDGRFTARLLVTNLHISIDAVDSSETMLHLLTKRVSRLGQSARTRLKTVHSDALAFNPEGAAYDLVISHFFLDCLSEGELATLLAHLKPHFATETTWLVSEFAIPISQPAATLARLLVATLYSAFGFLTGLKTRRLPEYASHLHQNGLSTTAHKSFLGGLLAAELWRRDSHS